MNAPKESTIPPSINPLLLGTCEDLNTSFLISSFDRLPISLPQLILSIVSYLLVRASYCFGILNAEKESPE